MNTIFFPNFRVFWIWKCILNSKIWKVFSRFENTFQTLEFGIQNRIRFRVWNVFLNPTNSLRTLKFEIQFCIPNFRIWSVWIRKKRKRCVNKKDEKGQNCHFTWCVGGKHESMEILEEIARNWLKILESMALLAFIISGSTFSTHIITIIYCTFNNKLY